jgi:hypothetical protein
MKSIDWNAHGKALHQGNVNRVRLITKLVHDILPTNSLIYRFIDDWTCCCPSCPSDNEDCDHIIRCSHPERHHWRKSFLVDLRKITDHNSTKPYLQTILLDGISERFEGRVLQPGVYPPAYEKLIRQQGIIGWRQLFNGRMSVEWDRLQDNCLFTQALQSNTKSGVLWTTAVITVLWKHFEIVWKIRNDVIHGHDVSTRNQIQRTKAHNQVKRIYNQRDNFLPRDRNFLFEDIADHLVMPTIALLNWLATYKPLFKDSIKKAKKHALDRVKAIATYFVPLGKKKKKAKNTMPNGGS